MTGQTNDLLRALLITGVVLIAGARFAIREAMPRRKGRHRRSRGSPRPGRTARPARTIRPAEPVPVAGGATGLLESIPHLEPVRRQRRVQGAGRLLAGIAIAAAIIAAVLFVFARQFAAWLETANF